MLDKPKEIKLKSGVIVDINAKEHSGQLSSVKLKKDSGWGIFVIGGVTCIGTLHEIAVGAAYQMKGEFLENQRYSSWEFKFKEYRVDINTSNGIRELLISECPGLGPALANRLVTNFQGETLKILEREPEKIAEFLKIGLPVAQSFSKWASGQAANLELKSRLYKIGITQGKVKKIIENYGAGAEQKIKKDCFALTKIHGFGFKTVAAIADLLGIPNDDPGRLRAALKYSLEEIQNEGHTCIHANDLIRHVSKLTEGVHQRKITPLLQAMLESKELISEKQNWDEYAKENAITL